jgi:hypothetical protein
MDDPQSRQPNTNLVDQLDLRWRLEVTVVIDGYLKRRRQRGTDLGRSACPFGGERTQVRSARSAP